MAPPPLDRDDTKWDKNWKSRSTPSFRLPRRTRRATYLCWAVVLAIVYFLVNSATRWTVPDAGSFFKAPEPFLPLRFPNLYSTLQRVVGGVSSGRWNRNVVFVAGNLTAASKLAGIACDMAEFRRSNVHLALMGFDTFDLNDFRRINGLPAEEDEDGETKGCTVFLHDARPDHAEQLSLERRKVASKSALRHINEFIHPQAFLVDILNEEKWFLDIVKEKSVQMKRTLIELGANSVDDLKWITRLDSGSLNAWHTPSFEIVIHADTHMGNLERLLKSIQNAYYPSKEHYPKRITIVLDPFAPIHPFLKEFLQSYSFPEQSRVSIKRPLLPKGDPQAALRNYVESFYTFSDDHSVLFLDPNTELSRWFCHYLLYTTLEYRYSFYQSTDASTLYGISLESPPADFTGNSAFPTVPHTNTPFLYPVPTSRAALFFPQHWTEFHSYLSHTLNPSANPGKRNLTVNMPPALALPTSPETSWHSLFTDLARARGYTMLYPSFKDTLARVHNEIPSHAGRSKPEARLLEKQFLGLLPEADLPQWSKLPMRDVWGQPTDSEKAMEAAVSYRNSITTCHLADTPYRPFEVDDLFCDADGKVVL